MAAIEALPTGEGASTAALAARLANIETALKSQPASTTTDLQAKLDATLARLGEAEAAAAARQTEAETAAAKAARDLALRDLTDAVTTGQPSADKLQALADPALDAALGPMADTGAPTLAALQAAFPDAARETLRLSREISAQDGWTDRLVDFLASQTEARSLTPQEGDGWMQSCRAPNSRWLRAGSRMPWPNLPRSGPCRPAGGLDLGRQSPCDGHGRACCRWG